MEGGELLDWELIHGSDTESTGSFTPDKESESSSVIDDGMILSDHFSVDNPITSSGETSDPSQNGVVELGDSFRVNPGEFLVDSSFDQLNDYQSGDACDRTELGFNDTQTGISVAGLTSGTLFHYEDASKCFSESDSSKSWSDSGGNELVSGIVNCPKEIVSDSRVASTEEIQGNGGNTVQVSAVRSGDEGRSGETVWWKMPLVLVKYCAFRIGPVWSVSMAAAVMGLLLLGRGLYNMKKKAQRFHLKVTIDDKKVSRVMSQAARLNEVFTEVRRVPVIRPALPSPGAWPVLSLR